MDNKEILDWLHNETIRNQEYHDHKENMMWVCFALFLSGFGALFLWLNGHDVQIGSKSLWIIGIIFLTLITILFILWQFQNRNIAGNKVETLIQVTTEILRSHKELSWGDWDFDEYLKLPKFIAIKVKRCIPTDRLFFNLVLLLVPIIAACTVLILVVCDI
jgi:hypothetical protein